MDKTRFWFGVTLFTLLMGLWGTALAGEPPPPDVCEFGGDCCDAPGGEPFPEGTVCRTPFDQCDAPEVCTGTSAECPDDMGEWVQDSTPCEDGLACTSETGAPQTPDHCLGGVCTGIPVDCTADLIIFDECNVDTCDPGTGACVPVPVADSTPCEDGDFCTSETGIAQTPDHCVSGICTGTPVDCSAEDDQCNVGTCHPGTGACNPIPVSDSTPCEDGLVCTSETGTPQTPDHCLGGVCTGTPVDCSAEDDQCNTGTCDPGDGHCYPDGGLKDGQPCDDGDVCTSENGVPQSDDECFQGVCEAVPVDCSGLDDQCNTGICDPSDGACIADPVADSTPCEDGDFCTSETGIAQTPDHCLGGVCTGIPVDCSAEDDECNVGTCSPNDGACFPDPKPPTTICREGSGDLCDPDEYCTGSPGEACPADYVAGSNVLYGGDRFGGIFTVDITSGAATPVGTLSGGCVPESTEIEWDALTGTAWNQLPDGGFSGHEFNIASATATGPCLPDGGAHNGIETVGGVWYATVIFGPGGPSSLHVLDPATGASAPIGPTGVGPISGLAYHVGSGIMYGIAGGPGPAMLYTINLGTGVATPVGPTSMQAGSLQFGPDGRLYAGGTGPNAGEIHTVNPATGASALLGPTGLNTPVTGLTLVDEVVCREGSGDICDPDEVCTGTPGDVCPDDFFEPDTTVCRPSGTGDLECDPEELCTGSPGDECPPDFVEEYMTPCGSDADTACTEPDWCDGVGNCLPNNEPCAAVTDSSLCFFDVQPDKGICTESREACLVDPACEAAGGTICANDECQYADGTPIPGPVVCHDPCGNGDVSVDVDEDYCEQTAQFRLIFTPDVKNYPAFKLNASNPGQFFYNLIVEGGAGATVPVSVEIPWPYVTKGGQPVHVYDGANAVGACVDSDGSSDGEPCATDDDCSGGDSCDMSCFGPGAAEQQFDARWTIEDWVNGVDTSGTGWALTCPDECGPQSTQVCTLDLDVVIPASGQAYVNIHLDYGLKGPWVDANPCEGVCTGDGTTPCADDSDCDGAGGVCNIADRYDRAASPGSDSFAEPGFDALVNNDSEDGPVGIADCTDYLFSHDDGSDIYADSVQNLDAFKGVAGAFGHVGDSLTGENHEGLILTLAKVSNPSDILKTTTTDEDGAYALFYKHKGKPTLYNVDLSDSSGTLLGTIVVELQGNGWTNVDFDSYATYEELCDIDKAFCECNGWCAAAEYGSGRQSGGSSGGDNGGGVCELAQSGESCTVDSDCCSSSCKGKRGNKTCK